MSLKYRLGRPEKSLRGFSVVRKISLAAALAVFVVFGQATTHSRAAEIAAPVDSDDRATARPDRLAQSEVPAVEASSTELVFWQTIQNSTDPADFENYLSGYPNGAFVVLAQNRLKGLSGSSSRYTMDLPWLAGMTTSELIQTSSLRNAIQVYAERKYRFRIRRFKSIEIKDEAVARITIELQYDWVGEETAVKIGRGTATLQKLGSSYKLVDFESEIPTSSQLIDAHR